MSRTYRNCNRDYEGNPYARSSGENLVMLDAGTQSATDGAVLPQDRSNSNILIFLTSMTY